MNNKVETYSLPSHWKTLICTKENLALVWEKLNEFPILFDDSVRGDHTHFLSEMLDTRSIILLTGGYGICRISNIIPKQECEVHLAFWDKRFKGRLEECKQVLRWLFSTLNLHRASVSIPWIAHATIAFTEAIGFRQEGVRRDSWRVNGRYLDVVEFGILESEVFRDSEIEVEVETKEIETNSEVEDNGKQASRQEC